MSEKNKWDVTEEEENRTTLPANDCRRFNGGSTAPPEIRRFWLPIKRKSASVSKPIIVIDRLRQY